MSEQIVWRKSRRSTTNGGACVEVATLPDRVLVRDSKDPDGPRLTFTRGEWRAFIDGIADGEFSGAPQSRR
ncbi:MAG: DUF397 domain-containing protein [Micromonosporaceae bacterium]